MRHYDICLQTIPGRDIKPAPQTRRSVLPHMPIYQQLLSLADQRDQARRDGDDALAASLKEEAQQIFDAWFDEQEARDDLEVLHQEQLTAARESIGRTAVERVEGLPF